VLFPPFLSRCVLAVIVTGVAYAEPQRPINADALLRELDLIEKRQSQSLSKALQEAYALLRPGASSGSTAAQLYRKAVDATRFDGLDGDNKKFANWKEKNEDKFRSKAVHDALSMYIRYLLMSLERAAAEDGEEFVEPSLQYAQEIYKFQRVIGSGDPEDREARKILAESIGSSPLTKWLGLGPYLPSAKKGVKAPSRASASPSPTPTASPSSSPMPSPSPTPNHQPAPPKLSWENSPGNVAGILAQNVRPYLKYQRDPRLLMTWDMEIEMLKKKLEGTERSYDVAQIEEVHLPALQYKKALDAVEIQRVDDGIAMIFELIRTHPHHPQFQTWVKKARLILDPPTPEPEIEPESAEEEPSPAASVPENPEP